MKIYTKTGDDGTTGLFAGPRVAKDHARIEAYGTVDELSSVLGAEGPGTEEPSAEPRGAGQGGSCGAESVAELVAERLRRVQGDLFSVGAELATPDPAASGTLLLGSECGEVLERWIDECDAQLDPLKTFILPGGTLAAAHLHWGRTVCRRAERCVVGLARGPDVRDCQRIVVYLNRLSDLLFVWARWLNAAGGVVESPWRPERAERS